MLSAGVGFFNLGSAAGRLVIYMQSALVLTPAVLGVSSFVSYTRIIDKMQISYHKKFSSLFKEFKIIRESGVRSITRYYFQKAFILTLTSVYERLTLCSSRSEYWIFSGTARAFILLFSI